MKLQKRYPEYLFYAFVVVFLLTAIRPTHIYDFMLENALTFIVLFLLIGTYTSFRLSNVSYTMIFIFMLFHVIASHYTYSLVPYEQWIFSVTGISIQELLGLSRNHYDRFVHFLFGFLISYPLREILIRLVALPGVWQYYFPLDIIAASSMMYEILEWGVAFLFGGELGTLYLGTQGDVWDAQKDMLMAVIGAVLMMSITAILNARENRLFFRELKGSVTPKY